MRLTVSKESDKWAIITKGKELRSATGDLSMVFVQPDLNKEDRGIQTALVKELKDKRRDEPGKNWVIYRGKVKEKKDSAETTRSVSP